MNEIALAKALKFTIGTGGNDLGEEGGFSDNPHDHGGRTNRGITQRSLDAWIAKHGLPFLDVKDLDDHTVHAFYADVWAEAHCDEMSLGLACAHFDWTANHGWRGVVGGTISGSVILLQETLQVVQDGNFGPKTRAALQAQDHHDLWREYNILRREWYQARVAKQPDQAVFLRGWLGRVDRLDAYIEGMSA